MTQARMRLELLNFINREDGDKQRVRAAAFRVIAGESNTKIRRPIIHRGRIHAPFPFGQVEKSRPLRLQFCLELQSIVYRCHRRLSLIVEVAELKWDSRLQLMVAFFRCQCGSGFCLLVPIVSLRPRRQYGERVLFRFFVMFNQVGAWESDEENSHIELIG